MHGWKSTYWKLRSRGSFDFPVLSVAAAARFSGRRCGKCAHRDWLGRVTAAGRGGGGQSLVGRQCDSMRSRSSCGAHRQAAGQHGLRHELAKEGDRRIRDPCVARATRRKHARRTRKLYEHACVLIARGMEGIAAKRGDDRNRLERIFGQLSRPIRVASWTCVALPTDSSLFALFHSIDFLSNVLWLSCFQLSARTVHKSYKAARQLLDSLGLAASDRFRRDQLGTHADCGCAR